MKRGRASYRLHGNKPDDHQWEYVYYKQHIGRTLKDAKMSKRYSTRARFGYWFDNLMSQGTSAKMRVLLIATLIYIGIMGLLTLALASNEGDNLFQVMWETMLYVFGQANPELEMSSFMRAVIALINVLYCLFFTAVLIGFITEGISSKMDEIATGSGKVLETGHTIILGFNEATLILLEELIEANKNQSVQQRVVVLDEVDWRETTDLIRKRFGRTRNHPQTRIICRNGSIFALDDLKRCSLETSRVIIINGDDDFDTIRAVMACTHLLSVNEPGFSPYLVSAIQGDENIAESSMIAENSGMAGILEYLPLNETLARIMVHTSRQPGLSDVYTELFNYADDELYVVDDDPCFPKLYGRSIAEINLMLKTSYAVGTCNGGKALIAAPNSVIFNEGDSLILIQEDDNPQIICEKPITVEVPKVKANLDVQPVSILVLGVRPLLADVLTEYAYYLSAESTVHIADSADAVRNAVKSEIDELFAKKRIAIKTHEVDVQDEAILKTLLDDCRPDSVVALANGKSQDSGEDDERMVRLLVYLRKYRFEHNASFSITSEIHQMANKELLSATGPDDFILASQMSALLMAQISQNRAIAEVFRILLSSDGVEVYMKRAMRYVQPGVPVNLHAVSQAVAEKGEIFIGLRQKTDGKYARADINPSKYVADMQTLRKYTFHEHDYFVVLAELDSRV